MTALTLTFQLLTVIAAVGVVFHPNVLHASILFLFGLMGITVLYLLAGSDVLAGTQLLIYVGGVTVVILFALMLTRSPRIGRMNFRPRGKTISAAFIAFGLVLPLLLGMAQAITHSLPSELEPADPQYELFAPKLPYFAGALLNRFVLPFEWIALLLLAALVGAVWMARPRT